MSDPSTGTGSERRSTPEGSRAGLALLLGVPLAVVGLVVGAVLLVTVDRSETSSAAVAPLELAAVPEEIAAHYRFAAANADAYRDVPCYCGCEQFLAHRDLYDCFVRADGAGWEAHASGCGVCIAESAAVRQLVDEGSTRTEIRSAVIEQFGSTPPTTPPT